MVTSMDTATRIPELTVNHIRCAYDREEWLGFGYLGERRSALGEEIDVSLGDYVVIGHANENGWSEDDLFEWLNSKLGRWFGEQAFRSGPVSRFDLQASSLLTLDFG